jgi:hypothetical protein
LTTARGLLKAAPESHPFKVENHDEKKFVGNERGISLAATNPDLQCKVNSMDDQMAKQRTELSQQKNEISSLKRLFEERISSLEKRFSKFQKSVPISLQDDVLYQKDDSDRKRIYEGNRAAPGGNCRRDVELYVPPQAYTDVQTFESLYGLSPNIIAKIGKLM